jgi:hypothetical protein
MLESFNLKIIICDTLGKSFIIYLFRDFRPCTVKQT